MKRSISRRTLAKGGAWALPVVVASATIPAYAASNETDICSYTVSGLTSQADANAKNNVFTYQINGEFVGNSWHPEVMPSIEVKYFKINENDTYPEAPIITSTSGKLNQRSVNDEDGTITYIYEFDSSSPAMINPIITVKIEPSDTQAFAIIGMSSQDPHCDSYVTYVRSPSDDIVPNSVGTYLVQGSTNQVATGEGITLYSK